MQPGSSRWLLTASVALIALAAITYAKGEYSKILSDPNIALLIPERGAEWIRFAEAPYLKSRKSGEVVTSFRKQFEVEVLPEDVVLTIRSMKLATVSLDGEVVLKPGKNIDDWKVRRHVDLSSRLSPGSHVLLIRVSNQNGPAVLLTYSVGLGLFTGEDWEASRDEKTWTPAISVERTIPAKESRWLPRTDQALVSKLPFILPVFCIVFFTSLAWHSRIKPLSLLKRITPGPKGVCWILLGGWALLAINNFRKLPYDVGFDAFYHLKYIVYVTKTGAIPLADVGWKMFEPPLYYLLSAGVGQLSSQILDSAGTVIRSIRLLSVLCGALQVVISYFAVRYVFPKREDLQKLGIIIGGLLPMNLYVSQAIGNEPMAGCFSGIVVVLGFAFLRAGLETRSVLLIPLLGLFLGFALLTRVTAVLLVPPLVLLLGYSLIARNWQVGRVVMALCTVFGIAVLVSGWYYLRNWQEFGTPFVGGWEPRGGIVWWQDPGYRTLGQFGSFGEALFYPVHASLFGFWDSIYSTFWMDGSLSGTYPYELRPPWNYGFMLAGAWLAVLPAAGIVFGILASLCRPVQAAREGQLFATCWVGLYFVALLWLYLIVPIYTTAKATYTVGLTPCYAVLGVTGLNLFMRNALSRAAIQAAIVCYGIVAYFAYFVI